MIVMPSNNTSKVVRELFDKYPDRIAILNNPTTIKYADMPNAYDNGCFLRFDETLYFLGLEKISNPMFVVCPDVVGCHDRTLALWRYYYPKIKQYNYPIAFVAQNGCIPETIPKESDWIFVGGLDPWKMNNIEKFVNNGKPVHVGRVNSLARLQHCERLGVKSVDGTGWMMARDKKHYDLLDWFSGNFKQKSLFEGENYAM